MKTTLILSIISILFFFTSCDQQPEKKGVSPITGLWSLHIMEVRDTATGEWSEWRDGMQGNLLYDGADNMSLHLTKKGYEKTDLDFPNFIDTIPLPALQHITGNYNYMAKYLIDEQAHTVQHSRISHSNPKDWNKVVKRKFSFVGDTLVLQPAEKKNANLRLKWVKRN